MSCQIGAKRQTYDPKTLEHAANLVRSNSITLNQASKTFCVPKTTLQNAVHNKYSGHKVGHKTYLNATEEQRIAEWAMHMSKIGYGRTRQELVSTVQKILDDDGRVTPFRDNNPAERGLMVFSDATRNYLCAQQYNLVRRGQSFPQKRLGNGLPTLRPILKTKLVTKIFSQTQRAFIMQTRLVSVSV